MASDPVKESEPERILVIRFSSLGDILLTAPAIRALRTRFPSAQIRLLVADEFREAAELIPGVDSVLGFDRTKGFAELLRLRRSLAGQYSILIDLQNSFRSAFLRWFAFPTIWFRARRYRFRRWLLIHFKLNLYRTVRPVALRYLDAITSLGGVDDQKGLELRIHKEIQNQSEEFLPNPAGSSPFVVLCPGARHFTKRWPVDRWRELAVAIGKHGYPVVVVGTSEETNTVRQVCESNVSAIALCGESVSRLAVLFAQAEVVVTNDSGLMHLAYGVGAPVISIFGPTVREFGFYPFRAKAEVIERNLPCRPCSAHGSAVCPKGHFRCMMLTEPVTVMNAIQRAMNRLSSSVS